jgi:hypothetical protein
MISKTSNMLIEGARDFKALTGSKTGSLVTAPILKGLVIFALVFLIAGQVLAQKALRITRMRQVSWDTYTKVWSPWPTE